MHPGKFVAKGGEIKAKQCGGKDCHIFRASGTFEIANSGAKVEILLIAGGGGAGGCNGGGGGAGGLIFKTLTMKAGKYSVKIGSGGKGNKGRTCVCVCVCVCVWVGAWVRV